MQVDTNAPMLTVHMGPPLDGCVLDQAVPTVVGRSSEATYRLNDPSVSRRHATVEVGEKGWSLTDTESLHGTTLNGERLEPNRPIRLREGDLVGIGPWVLRFGITPTQASTMMSVDDRATSSPNITRLERDQLGTLAERRLEALIRTAASLHRVDDERQVADTVARALVGGTGFQHAAVVRPSGGVDTLEILASTAANPRSGTTPRLSRTLLSAAMDGQLVQMRDSPIVQEAVSVVNFGLSEAMCLPVHVNDRVDALIYLDAEASAQPPFPDAAVFASAVADLCGFALGHIASRQLQERQEELLQDLKVARGVQERLMPEPDGSINGLRYALKAIPGRHVAGDLFGLLDLGDQRTAVFLGDVSGKGAGAGILMATVQTHIEALLERGAPLVEAIEQANVALVRRSAPHEFVTLWIGIIDSSAGTVECIDAGHGYAFVVDHEGAGRQLECEGGVPLGVDPRIAYRASTVTIATGERLVVVSDGVIEQPAPSGELFNDHRLLTALDGSTDAQADIARTLIALGEHASSEEFADDVTVASIALDETA